MRRDRCYVMQSLRYKANRIKEIDNDYKKPKHLRKFKYEGE